jgi:hypothetical protein
MYFFKKKIAYTFTILSAYFITIDTAIPLESKQKHKPNIL